MKIKHLLLGMLAVAAAVACKPDEIEVTPALDVNKTAASVAAEGGDVTIEVTSNVDWTASADQDWVSIDPASGKGSDKAVAVKVTVEPNEAEEARTAVVTVAADKLTKTVKVTQAAKAGETPEPGPEPEKQEYLLVGDAVDCGWDPTNGIVLTLTEGYYVAKEVGIQAKKGMHFTKNASWEGNIKGLHGLIAPDEIGEVGNNDISLTVGGAYDVYLTEALDKFYFMTPGKTPAEAVEHVEIAVSWGVCGAIDGNSWGASADPEMALEGEWYVAKDINFTEVNFKIRGNNSWADDVKWGRATKEQVCKLNEAIAVSTCTEYKEANPSAGDNENIYIGGSGVYDVYFSPEKKEVWVMNPGLKPGDSAPEVEVTYTVTGTIVGTPDNKKANYWNNANEAGLMALEGDYYVAKGVELDYDYRFSDDASGEDFVKFKICETGTWNAYGHAEAKVYQKPNTEIPVQMGGEDIYIDRSGVYDVYFDKSNGKVWVMEQGYKPGEEIARLDERQWMGEFDEMPILFDLGITEPGMLSIALAEEDSFTLEMVGLYDIEAYDNTSGVIYFTEYDWELDDLGEEYEILYSDLTTTSVKVVCEDVFGVADPITLAAVEEPYYDIELPGGGEGPEGAIPNGVYWISNSGKVMAPLAEDATSGVFPAKDMINFASTAKNAFTFTYDPDMTYYTIQDSYGRYLGQTDETGSITVTSVLPTDDTYGLYLWCVEPGYGQYGEAFDIYNAAYYYDLTYSVADNSWVLVYGGYENPAILPVLLPADYPVEEPEEPAGPEKITIAEFAALEDGDTVYELTGTITRIVTPYNSNYNNISINIEDETAEIQLFRLSCEGVADPAALTVGDEITVQGCKGSYDGAAQMAAGGKYISHIDKEAPAPEAGTYELSFSDAANRTSFSADQQVWEQNGIKLTNDKAGSSNDVADYVAPARFYKGSSLKVEKAAMTKIVFYLNTAKPASGLTDSINDPNASVTADGYEVTVAFTDAVDVFEVASLAAQIRMDSLTVYAE